MSLKVKLNYLRTNKIFFSLLRDKQNFKFGGIVLKRKNTQILKRGLYFTSNRLDSCIQKEHGSLISEMFGVWRNPNYTIFHL